ncbi:uncharacterized protein BN903_75 [Halorubrum sp. AJ67]|nr:uncharacterized protein BN903_75 [Halorubrum sp. AJ67]
MEDTSTRSESESPPEEPADPASDGSGDPDAETENGGSRPTASDGASEDETDIEALRERVESEYDFDDFGPSDMAQMSAEEWDAAFDPDTWITGDRLLDRVDAELKSRIATRDVFGVLERVREDGEERILVYSDGGVRDHPAPPARCAARGRSSATSEPVVALAAYGLLRGARAARRLVASPIRTASRRGPASSATS